MKKQLLSIFTLAFGVFAFGQIVGLNTPNPTATLDIVAKNATGTSTNVDGLLIPRVSRERAFSMISIPNSTLIYVNNMAGPQSGITANIDAVGYYYFDGAAWAKLNPSSSPTSSVNIYNSDGNLTSDRVVTQGTKTLRFNPTVINGFSVDGQTFSVDAVNNRIGMGTTTPQRKIHINGTLQLTNELNVGGNATTAGSAGTTGQVLVSNGAGNAPSWQAAGTEVDGVIGNEVLNATVGGALTRSGAGTTANPYTLGISDGDITTAKIADNNVTYAKINTPVRTINAADALAATDEGGFIYVASPTAVTITVPDTLPAGFHCVIIQQGAGQVTVAGAGLASARGFKTRAVNSAIGVIRKSPVYATVTGDAVN
jgi:hypothetical protein